MTLTNTVLLVYFCTRHRNSPSLLKVSRETCESVVFVRCFRRNCSNEVIAYITPIVPVSTYF